MGSEQGRATGMIGMSCDNLETSRDPYLTGGSKHKKELGTTLDIWEPPKPFDFATQSWTCRLIKLRLEMYINVGFSGSSPVSHRRHWPSLAVTSRYLYPASPCDPGEFQHGVGDHLDTRLIVPMLQLAGLASLPLSPAMDPTLEPWPQA